MIGSSSDQNTTTATISATSSTRAMTAATVSPASSRRRLGAPADVQRVERLLEQSWAAACALCIGDALLAAGDHVPRFAAVGTAMQRQRVEALAPVHLGLASLIEVRLGELGQQRVFAASSSGCVVEVRGRSSGEGMLTGVVGVTVRAGRQRPALRRPKRPPR